MRLFGSIYPIVSEENKKTISAEAEGMVVESEPKIYEIGYHVVPTVAEDGVATVANAVKDLVESLGGMVISDGTPSSIDLAYSMDHVVANKRSSFDSAYFGWIKLQMDPENILKIKDELDKNEDIFRFLIIKTVREDTLAKKPSVRPKKETTSASAKSEKTEEVKEEISEEEVDKAIEELVVE